MSFEPAELSRAETSPSTPRDATVKRARRGVGAPRSTIALLFVSILLPLALFALAAYQNRRDVERAAVLRVERTTGKPTSSSSIRSTSGF